MFNWKNIFLYILDFFTNLKIIYYFILIITVGFLCFLYIAHAKWEYRHKTTKIVADLILDDYSFLQNFAKTQNKNVLVCVANEVSNGLYSCLTDLNGNNFLAYYNNDETTTEFNENSNIIKVMKYPSNINIVFANTPLIIKKDHEYDNNVIVVTPNSIEPEQMPYNVVINKGEGDYCLKYEDCK